jgi:hypothetical protein
MFEVYIGGPKKRECRVSLSVKGGLNFTREAVNKYNPTRTEKVQILFDRETKTVAMKFDKEVHPALKCQHSGSNGGMVIQLSGFSTTFGLSLPKERTMLKVIYDNVNNLYTFVWPV